MTYPRELERYLHASIEEMIESRYLAQIEHQALLEQVIHDPNFYRDPSNYPPFFADHGTVHHHDVALQLLKVLDVVNGLLIPQRDERRLEFMKGYGVLLALIHDMGMADFSDFGRQVHAERITHLAFKPEIDDIIEAIWESNSANLAWRLDHLARCRSLSVDPRVSLRELLAMASCHSKTHLPIQTLNDTIELRRYLQQQVGNTLDEIYRQRVTENTQRGLAEATRTNDHVAQDHFARILFELQNEPRHEAGGDELPALLSRYYRDFESDSFSWLASEDPACQELRMDVVDTLRCLRCADALRQRGVTLKTSGGYEVFIDQRTANAVYALRMTSGELYLLEVDTQLSAGEANIASSEIDHCGDLRISFHRGFFPDSMTTRLAAHNAALVVNDIQADAIESFTRTDGAPGCKSRSNEVSILLEGVDDNLDFSELVREELNLINPKMAGQTRCVPSMQSASAGELERYLSAAELDWDLETRRRALERIARSGHKTARIDAQAAFEHVRLVTFQPGELVIRAGDPSGFVYIPLSDGLRVQPLGGYSSAPVRPWIPLGITGVIRGALRNSQVSSEKRVDVLIIPKEIYLRRWHATYSVKELTDLFQQRQQAGRTAAPTLSPSEKALILKRVSLFSLMPDEALAELADMLTEIRLSANQAIFHKGDPGDSMYVIVSGKVKTHAQVEPIDTLEAGEILGEMSLLDSQPRTVSATALTDLHLLRLVRVDFERVMAARVEVAYGVIQVLLDRLRPSNRESILHRSGNA